MKNKILILLFHLVFFLTVKVSGQEQGLRDFCRQYFMGLDITEHYALLTKTFRSHPDLELTDSLQIIDKAPFISYKIKKHHIIGKDTVEGIMTQNLTIKIDTAKNVVTDSLITISLVFNFGESKLDKKLLHKKYRETLSNIKGYTHQLTATESHNRNKIKYVGYAFHFKEKISIYSPLTIVWGRTEKKNYILKLRYIVRYLVKE